MTAYDEYTKQMVYQLKRQRPKVKRCVHNGVSHYWLVTQMFTVAWAEYQDTDWIEVVWDDVRV